VIAGTGAGTLGLVTASGHSDGDVLTLQADGTADWETPAGGGGGLSHWTEANATPVANEVTSWTPSSASANVTVVLSPKGTGAVAADIADGTSAGGNDRGSNAIDLQSYRGAATEVASGQYSVVIGTECTASALGAVAIGRQNTASQTNATAVGYSNTVSGWYSTAFGQLNTVSGDNAVAAGRDNTADADHAIALGFKANTNGVEGKLAVAAGIITGSKPAQAGIYVLRRQTTDATLTELTSDNGAASTDNQIVLADDTVFAITAVVAGYDAAGTEQFGGRLFALFKRGTGAASVALVGAIMKDTIETDAGLDVTIAADTTNGAAAIKVTGKASTTIRWCATATVAEVG